MKLKKILAPFVLATAISFAGTAWTEELTVGSVSAAPGDTGILVPITIDVPGNTAGASFTITYDSVLTLTDISSTFFDTFANQSGNLPIDVTVRNPPPDNDNFTTYNQPLIYSAGTDSTMVAAARISDGATENTMFTLVFSVAADATAQGYAINIEASNINNTAAGYPAGGEDIPMLIGYTDNPDPTSDEYPEIIPSIVAGTFTVTAGVTDTDGDGIDDDWENTQFGNLTTATATSDFDEDGYLDVVEYENGTNPRLTNTAGGTGYNGLTDKNWTMLDENLAEDIVVFRDGIAADFGTRGLYYFDGTIWTQLNSADPQLMIQANVDGDDDMELVVYFPGYGIFIWDSGWSSPITDIAPENMVAFGDKIAIDFGSTYGLYLYDTVNSFTLLAQIDSTQITAVDVDSDNTLELAVVFPGYGLFIWDNIWTGPMATIAVDGMIAFGNSLAIDFGASGLYLYSTAGDFTQINASDPSHLAAADLDDDGTLELATYFQGYGIFVWDDSNWSTSIINEAPEKMIAFGNTLAIDLGSSGLYSYTTASGLSQTVSQNASLMVASNTHIFCQFQAGIFMQSNQSSIALPDSLLMNLSTNGLYLYDSTGSLDLINGVQSSISIPVDFDRDGNDEIFAFFPGYGIFVWDGSWSTAISTAVPESMILFENIVVVDFGSTNGLMSFDGVSWTQLNSADPQLMIQANVDGDDDMELVVYFPGYGIFIWDGGWSSPITDIAPENMVAFGNKIAIDFGSTYGLYLYDTVNSFTLLAQIDSTQITAVNVDSDNTLELAVVFPGYGLFIWDNIWTGPMATIAVDGMIAFGNSLAIDFGASGLYLYSTAGDFTQINASDPSHLAAADLDDDGTLELATYFQGYGIFVWDDTNWSGPISTQEPDFIVPLKK